MTAPRVQHTLSAIVTLFALALVGACSSGGDGTPSAPSSTASSSSSTTSPPPLTSETPSATASATTSSGDAAANARAVQALLPDGAMAKVGFIPASPPEEGAFAWFEPCSGKLPSNQQITGGAHARWTDGPLTLDQVIVTYPAGVAADAVDQAKTLLTCTSWTFKDGSVATRLAPHKVSTVGGVAAQTGWCETIKALTRCTAVVATGDSATRVWVLAPTRKDAEKSIDTFATLAAARLLSQPR